MQESINSMVGFHADDRRIHRGGSLIITAGPIRRPCASAELVITRGAWRIDAAFVDGAELEGYPATGGRFPMPAGRTYSVIATNIGNGPSTFDAHLELV